MYFALFYRPELITRCPRDVPVVTRLVIIEDILIIIVCNLVVVISVTLSNACICGLKFVWVVFFHWFWTSDFRWILFRALFSLCPLNVLTRMNDRTDWRTMERKEVIEWKNQWMKERTKVRTNGTKWMSGQTNEKTNVTTYSLSNEVNVNEVSRCLSFFYEKN